ELYELDEETAILNPYFQIKQVYEIEIFSKDQKNLYKDFHLAVGANATKCKVYLNIKEGSKVSYNPRFEKELLVLINKSKIRAGILINIFDEMLSDTVSKISSYIRVEETAVYNTSETFLISQAFEPTPTTNDALIFHYDKNEEVDDNSRIDYSQRGFIQSVLKDELLIEYIKPQEGKSGRNCRGEFMAPKEPEVNYFPDFQIDETIQVTESDRDIKYRAVENGYIAIEGKQYSIKSDVDVGEISFKTTGSIVTGLESDVTVNVKENDALKDAVGAGMVIDVSEIDIEGNVGSNAKVNAKKATIGGQTHKTAQIRADDLTIHVHKGTAYGKNITITRLEQGRVEGDIVKISQAVGGQVRAKEVKIAVCASHVKVVASRFIEIEKLHGSENIFTIDPLLKRSDQSGLDSNQEDIKNLEIEIKSVKKEIVKYTKLIKDGIATFNDVKKRLLHYKKNGVKMPVSFVKQYKKFQSLQKYLENIKKDYEQKNDHYALLTTKTNSFQDDIFAARIINRDRWIGYNELKFKLVDPPIEVAFYPKEGSLDKIFALVEVEDGKYEIQAVKE
ncbi:MAG: DUF342 domain-containing protein, partial [Sulfurimonas sp.]|nr:DUF342 domain-containing protein [Sulfurimonas sp.]